MPRSHLVKLDTYHYLWSRSHRPVLEISPGDRVRFQVGEVTSSQLTRNSGGDDVAKLDSAKFYPLAGPVSVKGAKVGDALAVDVLKVETANWGWSAVIPGLGALEDFTEPFLWKWKISKGRNWVPFKNDLKVRLRPFCGVMGVAPAAEGFVEAMPPGNHGGNLDTRHLTSGSRLLLPVWVDGGLFSVGDIHAAQGDGEVCVTAIECPGEVTLRFDLVKGAKLDSPHYFTAQEKNRERYYVTTGIASDLMEASRVAIRAMINALTRSAALTREEAYIFCSVAGDLRIHEVVDKPNWVVGFMISQYCLGPVWKRLFGSNS